MAIRAAPRGSRRRHGVRSLARRRADDPGRERQNQPRAHRPSELVSALRRGGTHSPLPLPDRDLLIVADEGIADNAEDGIKHTWVFDIRDPANPISISTFPVPDEADYVSKGGHFGPHNLHENRPGSFVSSELIFATYQNAGVRAFDISNEFRPKEVAAWVPPAPARMRDVRPNRPQVIQTAGVFVDAERILYVTDYNAGLYILQYEGD